MASSDVFQLAGPPERRKAPDKGLYTRAEFLEYYAMETADDLTAPQQIDWEPEQTPVFTSIEQGEHLGIIEEMPTTLVVGGLQINTCKKARVD